MTAMGALMGLVAILFPDDSVAAFAEGALVASFAGIVISVAASGPRAQMKPVHGFLLTTTVWLNAAVAGALPLFLWGLSPADAFFESMSGITTTGSTVMSGLDQTPRGVLFWRALLQGFGGIGFIVTGVALLPILKVGGMQLFRTESSEKGEKELANATRFALATVMVYGGLTLACAIIYRLGGMSAFDAACHAMSTLSTGGYSNYDASFGHFQSPFLHYAGTVFMALGALPFAWYIRLAVRRTASSEQVKVLVLFLLGVSLVLAIWRVETSDTPFETAFREASFNVVSVVTTTGYATTDYTVWGPFAAAAFFVLTAVGGCTGSTAGGAKMMRWIVFFRLVRQQITLIHSPNAVAYAKYEGRRLGEDVTSGVAAFFTFYALTCGLLAVALDLVGLDLETAISGAVTAVANVGPGVGPLIGPAGNFASLDATPKVLLALGMYLGRLEMLAAFVLLTRSYWRAL